MYENELADVAETKIAGLKKHYGLTDSQGTLFFAVHGVLDKKHSAAWWDIVDKKTQTPTDELVARQAVVAARDALWNFLTGVCRAYLPEALTPTC